MEERTLLGRFECIFLFFVFFGNHISLNIDKFCSFFIQTYMYTSLVSNVQTVTLVSRHSKNMFRMINITSSVGEIYWVLQSPCHRRHSIKHNSTNYHADLFLVILHVGFSLSTILRSSYSGSSPPASLSYSRFRCTNIECIRCSSSSWCSKHRSRCPSWSSKASISTWKWRYS